MILCVFVPFIKYIDRLEFACVIIIKTNKFLKNWKQMNIKIDSNNFEKLREIIKILNEDIEK